MDIIKHIIWASSLVIIILIIGLTLSDISKNPYQIKFSVEMDNKTYELYKTAVYESTTSKSYDYNNSKEFKNTSYYDKFILKD